MKPRLWVALVLVVALAGCGTDSTLKTLRTSPNASQRAAAAEALGRAKVGQKDRQKVVDALVEATLDPSADVKVKAVQALANMGGDEARQALLDVVAGRQQARAALKQYEIANEQAPNQAEILIGMARAQTELGQNDKAEKTWDDAATIIAAGDPQSAAQQLQQVYFGYLNLSMAYQKAGNKAAYDRVSQKAQKIDAKMKAAQAQGGGMGGMFGGGMGMPGGLQGMPGIPGGSIPMQP